MIFNPLWIGLLLTASGLAFLLVALKRNKHPVSRTSTLLWVAALVLLSIALCKPAMPQLQPSEEYNSLYDVYFVVDLTSSANAEDWGEEHQPRLAGIRADIQNLLDEYVGAKFSLIGYNTRSANIRVPLTPDATALATGIRTMIVDMTQYTKPFNTITQGPWELLSRELQTREKADSRAALVFYFGDGEIASGVQNVAMTESTSHAFNSIPQLAAGIKVYAYGTTEGGKMRVETGNRLTTGMTEYIQINGVDAVSVAQPENLQQLAQGLGAEFEHRNPEDYITPLSLSDSQKLELTSSNGGNVNSLNELYYIPLGLSTIILGVDASLIMRKRRRLKLENFTQ